MDKQEISKYLAVIRRACDLIEHQLQEGVSEAFQSIAATIPVVQPASAPAPPPVAPVEIPQPMADPGVLAARKAHIDALMAIDCWPLSVPQFQANIVPTESDQHNRAGAILDSLVGSSLEGKRILDYGCGDGYVSHQAARRGAALVQGFDVMPANPWERLASEKVQYTTDPNALSTGGYDVALLFDVLDHCTDPLGVMAHVKHVCTPGAKVYVRCHPWTSHDASHLPRFGLNKAYIHLFLKWEEIVGLGFQPLYTRCEKDALTAYDYWFRDFKIVKRRTHETEVGEFFHVPAFKELLANEQQISISEIDSFLARMRVRLVDYTLEVPG